METQLITPRGERDWSVINLLADDWLTSSDVRKYVGLEPTALKGVSRSWLKNDKKQPCGSTIKAGVLDFYGL